MTIDMGTIEVRRVNSIGVIYGDPIPTDEIPWEAAEAIRSAILETHEDVGRVEADGQTYRYVRTRVTAESIGREIGRAIARDVVAAGMPREWTGLDPQDADRIPPGIDIDIDDVERHARAAYRECLQGS